jgi:hypothetical protein
LRGSRGRRCRRSYTILRLSIPQDLSNQHSVTRSITTFGKAAHIIGLPCCVDDSLLIRRRLRSGRQRRCCRSRRCRTFAHIASTMTSSIVRWLYEIDDGLVACSFPVGSELEVEECRSRSYKVDNREHLESVSKKGSNGQAVKL